MNLAQSFERYDFDTFNTATAGQASADLGFGLVGLILYCCFLFILLAIAAYLYWRIAKKAGYPGIYGILALIPFVGFVLSIIFVFGEWPIEKELKELKAKLKEK